MTLTEPDFYIAIVAALSLILSQLPPIKTMFSKEKIEVYGHPNIAITHVVGNPNTLLNISIWNSGAKPIRLNKLSMTIKDESENVHLLPLSSVHHDINDPGEFLYRPIRIEPGSDWTKTFNFAGRFPLNLEKRRVELVETLDVERFRHDMKPDDESSTTFFASDEAVQEAKKFFDELFVWRVGSYSFNIDIETDFNTHSYRAEFTIFESQHQKLRRFEEYVRYGHGLDNALALNEHLVWCPTKNADLVSNRKSKGGS